jgi:hypothetical protein
MEKAIARKVTASGIAMAAQGLFLGVLLGTDGVNDPLITIYDNASAASGTEVMPTTTFDASALGLNGFMPGFAISCINGLYVEITCAGTVEVTVLYRPWP